MRADFCIKDSFHFSVFRRHEELTASEMSPMSRLRACSHSARVRTHKYARTRTWHYVHMRVLCEQTKWPPNSPHLYSLHCHVCGAVLKNYHKLQLKFSKTTDELKVALQTIHEELPQEHINKPTVN